MNPAQAKILAIIPCYNEDFSIGNLLEEFQALDFPCDTLVIDDGSEDQTYAIARRYTHVIRFEENQSVPAAVKRGIGYAIENGYEYCIQIDGDGQHIPGEIARLHAAATRSSANFLIGSRYYGHIFPWPCSARRVAGAIISTVIAFLFKSPWIYDSTSGMRMMDKKAMAHFYEHMDPRSPDAMFVVQAIHAGLSVEEVPVKMRPRLSGKSYVSGVMGVCFLLRLLWKIIALRFTR